MNLTSRTVMYNFEQEVSVGDLSTTLVAQVWENGTNLDIEFIDNLNIKYRGIDVSGYDNWKKFRNFHKEMGIDYDKILSDEFDKIFTKEAIREAISKIKLK